MATSFYDRVKMSVASAPGTGTITLGAAASGFRTFDAADVANGATVSYAIEDGPNWEVGHGTYTTAGTLLARTTILGSSAANNAAIAATANAVVYLTLLAEDVNAITGVSGGGATSTITARYWRFDQLTSASFPPASIGDIVFYNSAGGVIPIVTMTFSGGTPAGAGANPSMQTDDTDGTDTTWTDVTAASGDAWVEMDFGTPITPLSFRISQRPDSYTQYNWASFVLQHSTDGATWVSGQTITNPQTTVAGAQNTFDVTEPSTSGDSGTITPTGSFTVATLPTGTNGNITFASDGRKAGEAAGAGTGVYVGYSGGAWRRISDDTAVVA